jgi:hypothetical protein
MAVSPASTNCTPAASSVLRMAATVRIWAAKGPGCVSRRLIEGSDTPEASASFDCSQRNNDRAARTCSLVSNLIPQVLTILRDSLNTLGITIRVRSQRGAMGHA